VVEETARTLSAPEFVASEPAAIEAGDGAESGSGSGTHGPDRISLMRAAR
jgi:hypothetical protein